MDRFEMSNEFDVLYNNVMSNLAPGIDEYEKSLFLTRAQDDIVKAYHDPRGNKFMEGFDGSEKRQIDFSGITKNTELELITDPASRFDLRSKVYKFPDDCFIVVNEQVFDLDSHNNPIIEHQYSVLPITYQQYAALTSKPFKYPPKHVVWRIITSYLNGSNSSVDDDTVSTDPYSICEIIGLYSRQYGPNEGPLYKMRYLRRPRPIILVNLQTAFSGLTIDGEYEEQDCELDPILHREIVLRAVELAAATYNPQAVNTLTGIGLVSSTNLGVVPSSKNN